MMQSVHQRRLASSCRCSRSLIRGRRPVVTSAQASPTIETLDLPRRTFIWKGHRTNYVTAGCGQPVVLVHGFGASSGHFRRNIAVLAKEYKVYAVDLLGFGASDKPQIEYSMELWRDQVRDFMQEFVDVPAVMVGNSIGSLVSCMVTAERPDSVRGLCLLNCVGAMNNKGVLSDWRIWIVLPLLLLIDLLLKSPLAAYLFDKYRTPDNIRGILSQVYRNQESVTDDLVELLYRPSCDEGALGVFVSVMTGPPGPKPWDVIPRINKTLPVLILWGDADTFIPADGPMGKWFQALPGERPGTKFEFLADVGHCPHDDRPDEVHDKLLPWLRDMFSSDNGNGNGVVCEGQGTGEPEAAPLAT